MEYLGTDAILWHCSAGKDRAGMASVFLLSALGVDRETVIRDFILTNDFYSNSINSMVTAVGQKTTEATILEGTRLLIGVDRSWVEGALDSIDATYGSMDKFLKTQLGLSSTDI